jgi:hypothetical protein
MATTLVQQRSENDCVLAAIAMAAGKQKWEDAWTDDDLKAVIESKGVANLDTWLKRMGYEEYKDYREVYCSYERLVKVFLWQRRALLSVDSLNNEHGSHMVYWDGTRVWDPQEGREGKLFHRILTGCCITRAFIFAS